MEFRELSGYPTYEISTTGTVRNKKSKYVLSNYEIRGYLTVSIGYKGANVFIHRLVAKTFLPNLENKRFVKHIDGNKKNNDVTNLRWK